MIYPWNYARHCAWKYYNFVPVYLRYHHTIHVIMYTCCILILFGHENIIRAALLCHYLDSLKSFPKMLDCALAQIINIKVCWTRSDLQ